MQDLFQVSWSQLVIGVGRRASNIGIPSQGHGDMALIDIDKHIRATSSHRLGYAIVQLAPTLCVLASPAAVHPTANTLIQLATLCILVALATGLVWRHRQGHARHASIPAGAMKRLQTLNNILHWKTPDEVICAIHDEHEVERTPLCKNMGDALATAVIAASNAFGIAFLCHRFGSGAVEATHIYFNVDFWRQGSR